MKAILFVILSLFANFLFAQGIERKVLRGIVVVDSFDVEAVTVRNITQKLISTVSFQFGQELPTLCFLKVSRLSRNDIYCPKKIFGRKSSKLDCM